MLIPDTLSPDWAFTDFFKFGIEKLFATVECISHKENFRVIINLILGTGHNLLYTSAMMSVYKANKLFFFLSFFSYMSFENIDKRIKINQLTIKSINSHHALLSEQIYEYVRKYESDKIFSN